MSAVAQDYHIVIGLEVHVQLLTASKLFCGCRNQFGQPPNSATCPVCLGLPGSLPVMNRKAFELAVKAALALNCTIAPFTKWDRKNYYYPDLPKNYQISQYDLPFSSEGWLEIETSQGQRKMRILRVHLEEDAGKMLHDEKGGGTESLVDLNRTGTPLLEIVSHPDMTTPEEAKAYLEEIRLLLREIGVSDCEMQEGSLRCDANINLHVPVEATQSVAVVRSHAERGNEVESVAERGNEVTFVATPIVEVKNLNSFRAVERALKYEAERQLGELHEKLGSEWSIDRDKPRRFRDRQVCPVLEEVRGKPGEVSKATVGWREEVGRTDEQRRKEEAADYRYFPDPDLVPILVDPAWLDEVWAELGELPAAQRERLVRQYGLSEYDTGVLTRQGRAFVAYFEEAARVSREPKEACNWLTNEVLQALNERKQEIGEFAVAAPALGLLIQQCKQIGLPKQRAREVFAHMLETGEDAERAIHELGFDQVLGDEDQLRDIVRKAIAANAKAVADFKKGKTKAADAIKGAIMRETKGMAKVEVVQQILLEELQKV
ncbi:MAG: Asp-tRNA(Asn)/Glu-tRNA(Gln) amidotransferase subunit GatB [Gemmataceae bacterium]